MERGALKSLAGLFSPATVSTVLTKKQGEARSSTCMITGWEDPPGGLVGAGIKAGQNG